MQADGAGFAQIKAMINLSGRYRLDEQLGEGAMAVVYRGWDSKLEAWRAFKVLAPAFSERTLLREMFVAEALAMAKLEHPNVVRL